MDDGIQTVGKNFFNLSHTRRYAFAALGLATIADRDDDGR